MSKRQFIILLGILVALSPYSGLPGQWTNYADIVVGLLIVILAYGMNSKRPSAPQKSADGKAEAAGGGESSEADLPFVEHRGLSENLPKNK